MRNVEILEPRSKAYFEMMDQIDGDFEAFVLNLIETQIPSDGRSISSAACYNAESDIITTMYALYPARLGDRGDYFGANRKPPISHKRIGSKGYFLQ